MEIDWLEDFLSVLEEGGFSRAAERRAVSQSAFSRRIRALEQWVAAPLFDRNTHTVKLTSAGERFRPFAEETLRHLHAGREEAQAAAQATSETLRFAATHALSLTFFPTWLRSLESVAPMLSTVQLTADNMVACERLMVEGRSQFLLCHHHDGASSRLTSSAFRSVKLGEDVLLPVAAPSLQLSEIKDAPFLAYSAESGMGRILNAAWMASGRNATVKPAFASHLASVLAAMARDGRGVAWSPLSLVADDLTAGRLVRAGSADDEVPMEIHLFRPKARQSAGAEELWHHATQVAQEKNAISSAAVSSGRSS